MKKVYVIGMGLSARDLTSAYLEIIHSADLLIGGRRHLDHFEELDVEKRVVSGRVGEIIEAIRAAMEHRQVVVLASGDPLLFGIGARIVEGIGKDRVTVLPNISSIAAAFARIKQPWDEARLVSLHGRDRCFTLLSALKADAPVAVPTDPKQTPAWLAGWLLERGVDHVQMVVFERLGDKREAVAWYTLEAASRKNFAQPNLAILLPVNGSGGGLPFFSIGMPEAAYRHERGLITKSEVRAVTLAKLNLGPGMTMWDLGAGSGAVGIEASLLLGDGRIIAVEKKPERVEQIRANAIEFGVYNHEVVRAELPDGLTELALPDRIFVGGGGRDLAAIVRSAADHLKPGGVMVVNTVLVENLSRIVTLLEEADMETEVVQMQVSRSTPMPWSVRMEAQNPVWIIQASQRRACD